MGSDTAKEMIPKYESEKTLRKICILPSERSK
jgi:hypothetical protein